MSLPNGMKWEDDKARGAVPSVEGKQTRYTLLRGVRWLQLEDILLSGTYLLPIRHRAHAELIIRAIEAPETLTLVEEAME